MASSDNMVRSTEQLGNDVENAEAEVRDRTRALASDPWGAALLRQQRERNAQNGMGTYNQMRDLVRRQQLDELNNGIRAEEAIASALKIAKGRKDGQIPGVVVDYLNRQFGFDGKTSGLMGGGIDQETKDFNFVFGERDQAGNIVPRKKTIPLAVQLGLMEGYPGMFSPEDVASHRNDMVSFGKFSDKEIDSYSKVAQFARDKRAKRMEELSPRDTKLETEKLRQAEMDRRLFARLGAGNGYPMKEVIGALSQMQSYLDSNSTGMSEEARQQMQQAIAAGYAGLASTFLQKRQPTAQPGGVGQDEADTSLPEGMKEGDEMEHNGKRYTLGYKDGKPMWILKKNGGGVK